MGQGKQGSTVAPEILICGCASETGSTTVLCDAPWVERATSMQLVPQLKKLPESQANRTNWWPLSPMLYKKSSLVFLRHTNYQSLAMPGPPCMCLVDSRQHPEIL